MQIIQSKGNIVEKVFRDKNGKLVRAKFFVYENAGRIKAKLLDFSYIETLKGVVLSLSEKTKETISALDIVFSFVFKPLNYSLSTIYSIGSKPRAPTF